MIDFFEKAIEEIISIANFMCKYLPEVMEGTAAVGAEEAEPFEAVAEAGCKFLKAAEDVFHLASDVIHDVDDAVSCAEVKASTHTFAVYTGSTWGRKISGGNIVYPDFKVGQLAGDAYKNGKNCINFPSAVVSTAKSAWAVYKDNIGGDDDDELM
jgi:hypothetical protein